jgi:hypothetical protein
MRTGTGSPSLVPGAKRHLRAAVTACCPYIEFLPSELSESPLRATLVTDDLQIGRIVEVSGSAIRVELDGNISELTRTFRGKVYLIGQFGSIVKIHFGRIILFAYVRLLRMRSEEQLEGGVPIPPDADQRVMEVELFAEGIWSATKSELSMPSTSALSTKVSWQGLLKVTAFIEANSVTACGTFSSWPGAKTSCLSRGLEDAHRRSAHSHDTAAAHADVALADTVLVDDSAAGEDQVIRLGHTGFPVIAALPLVARGLTCRSGTWQGSAACAPHSYPNAPSFASPAKTRGISCRGW